MRLADFILRNIEPLVTEWERFAATRQPAAQSMTQLALRDHIEEILRAIAQDLATPQTDSEQRAKSLGQAPLLVGAPETAAQTHGLLRARSGFDINQMASEYRALRASVQRLWFQACGQGVHHLDDVVRFNEAIDQALAESVAFYSSCVEQSRNLFLGMLGHDMCTPLQAIQMTAACLGRLHAGATVTEAANRLMKSGKRMQSLLDDLVVFNRANFGLGIPVDCRPGDLGQILSDAVEQLSAAHPDRQIELEVRGSTVGSWDEQALQRMLDNLVGNALRYGQQGRPVRVVVTGQASSVAVEVHNEGHPIDQQALDSLFDPLKRGLQQEECQTRDSGSLGLGLYIAREVAKAHGGDIEARSNGDETVFVASLSRWASNG
jgi:signal transduction histidine kinase